MRKKVRVAIPLLVKEILKNDLKYYDMKMEKLCNIIIHELGYMKTLDLHRTLSEEIDVILNFNLNEVNSLTYRDMINEREEKTETKFFRKVLSTYVNLHPSLRERVIYKGLFRELNYAIKKRYAVKILVNRAIDIVTPLEVVRDEMTGYNIVKFQEENKVYKIKEIRLINII